MKSPIKILQEHAIEVEPSDPRTTEQVVQALIDSGIITLAIDCTLDGDQSKV